MVVAVAAAVVVAVGRNKHGSFSCVYYIIFSCPRVPRYPYFLTCITGYIYPYAYLFYLYNICIRRAPGLRIFGTYPGRLLVGIHLFTYIITKYPGTYRVE